MLHFRTVKAKLVEVGEETYVPQNNTRELRDCLKISCFLLSQCSQIKQKKMAFWITTQINRPLQWAPEKSLTTTLRMLSDQRSFDRGITMLNAAWIRYPSRRAFFQTCMCIVGDSNCTT